ncbi:hypothetical protein BGZ76_007471 [Entomortierella beljakovae]|nr:hypothetical protein BGZ76_007471 [Entomortierella beljakovae]
MKFKASRFYHSYFSKNDYLTWTYLGFCEYEVRLESREQTLITIDNANAEWRKNLEKILASEVPAEVKTRVKSLLSNNDDHVLAKAGFVCNERQSWISTINQSSKVSVGLLNELIENVDQQKKIAVLVSNNGEDPSIESSSISKRKHLELENAQCRSKEKTGKRKITVNENNKESSWTAATILPWPKAKYKIFNISVETQRNKLNPAVLQDLHKQIREYRLSCDEDIDWEVASVFRQQTELSDIQNLLIEFYPNMQLKDPRDHVQGERAFFWTIMHLISNTWARASLKESHNEGWFGAHLHGPLLNIFSDIKDTTLKMTEIRSLGASMSGLNHKHDAVLRHDCLKLDLLITESKPNSGGWGRATDIKKLETGMTANLMMVLEKVPCEKYHLVRAFSILLSGTDIYLLEARFISGVILIYKIGQFKFPAVAFKCNEVVDGLILIIKLKRRIEKAIATIQDLRMEEQVSSSQEDSAII